MRIAELLDAWTRSEDERPTEHAYSIRLPIRDAAKIEALAELYPGQAKEQIITDLLRAALYQLETAMPYIPGEHVVAHDEQGDPIHEDVGLTPRFQMLTQKYLKALQK